MFTQPGSPLRVCRSLGKTDGCLFNDWRLLSRGCVSSGDPGGISHSSLSLSAGSWELRRGITQEKKGNPIFCAGWAKRFTDLQNSPWVGTPVHGDITKIMLPGSKTLVRILAWLLTASDQGMLLHLFDSQFPHMKLRTG